MTVKEKLVKYLDDIGTPASGIVNPDRKSNEGAHLFNALVWQEVSAIAEAKLKEAWATLADEGLVKQDEDLRAAGAGEHIEAESDHMTALVTVSNPRYNLNKEVFLAKAAKKFKVPVGTVSALMKECEKETKAPLKKRILEV